MGEIFISFGIITTIIWIVIGWRAMRAHEKIANGLGEYLASHAGPDPHILRKENAAQHKLYKQFILQHPEVASQPSKVRHEQLRDWLISRGEADPGASAES